MEPFLRSLGVQISKTVTDLLKSRGRTDLVRQAISDGRREGFISEAEAQQLRQQVQEHIRELEASDVQAEEAAS